MAEIIPFIPEIAGELLLENKIGVIPTDTLYGIVGRAKSKEVVERIYRTKKRDRKKPFIIILNSLEELIEFGVKPSPVLEKIWRPEGTHDLGREVSCILPCKKYPYLHCGKKSLAFRIPRGRALKKLLSLSGPLVAPSANPEGKPPAKNIKEAIEYFGENVDFYIRGKAKSGVSSTLVEVQGENISVLREGIIKKKEIL